MNENATRNFTWFILSMMLVTIVTGEGGLDQLMPSEAVAAGPSSPPTEPVLRIETGAHLDTIGALDVDAAGRYVVTGSWDKTVRVWDLQAGKLVRILRVPIDNGAEGRIIQATISPDGKIVVCGGYTGGTWEEGSLGVVYVFEVATGHLIKRLDKFGPEVNGNNNTPVVHGLKFSKDGRHLIAILTTAYLPVKTSIRVYRTSDYAVVQEDSGSFILFGMDVDEAGRIAVARQVHQSKGAPKLVITLYDMDLKVLAEVETPPGVMASPPRFSPDGSRVASSITSGWDQESKQMKSRVAIFAGKDLSQVATLDADTFSEVAWSADGRGLYAASSPKHIGVIRAWPDALKSDHSDFSVANSLVGGLRSLRDGGMLFATADPAMGLFRGSGAPAILFRGPVMQQQGIPMQLFLSDDGMTVGWSLNTNSQAQAVFDLNRLQIREGQDKGKGLNLPETHASWLSLNQQYGFTQLDFPNGAKFGVCKIVGQSHGHAITPDGERVLKAATLFNPLGGGLQFCDKQGEAIWTTPLPATPMAVNVSKNGRYAVAALRDGTIRWYSLQKGEEVFALFAHPDGRRWVFWTPQGYYDASPGAEELIGWHVNQGKDQEALFYPVAQFFEKFYRPDVIATVIKTSEGTSQALAKLGEKESLNIRTGMKLPPKVAIVSPKAGESFDRDEVDVQIQAADQGGGVDEIRLYHNGKIVGTDTRDLAVTGKVQTGGVAKGYRVRLTEGGNSLKAVAFSKDRIEGNPDEMTIQLKAVGKPATLHLFLVGINEYKNPALNLNYALPDAQGVQKFFTGAPSSFFKEIKRYELYDKAATKAAIVGKLQELQATAPQDVVVIYLAGHGESLENTWYFIPYEIVTPEKEEQVKSQGLSSVELKDQVAKIGAQKVLVLIDACKSGSAMLAFASRGVEDRKAMAQLARATGTHVVAASTKDQFAAEVKDLGHGVFTYTLLDGLSGKADGSPKDGTITVRELLSYIESRLPEISEKYKQQAQYPVVDSRGQDFPLATVR